MTNNTTTHLEHTLGDEDSETTGATPFMVTALQNIPGRENSLDYNWPTRHRFLENEITARVGTSPEASDRMSNYYVFQIAAERYFMLISEAIESMSEMFSPQEFGVMLNTTCSPVWDWDRYCSMASFVADDNGVGRLSELEPGSLLSVLLGKLAPLTTSQNAALVDACERTWRNLGTTSMEESLEAMGFRFASAE